MLEKREKRLLTRAARKRCLLESLSGAKQMSTPSFLMPAIIIATGLLAQAQTAPVPPMAPVE